MLKLSPVTISTLSAVCYILFYVFVGIVFYVYVVEEEGWTPLHAAYFALVTSTTIGYGDICPSTTISRLFTVVYGFIGITVVSNAISVIANWMMDQAKAGERKRMKERIAKKEKAMIDAMEGDGPPPEPEKDPPPNSTGAYVGAFLPMIVFMGLGVAFGLALEFDVVDSIYFAFATCTTIGYGDFSPVNSNWGMLVACFYMPLAIVAITKTLTDIGDIEMRTKIASKEFDILDLLKADDDGSIYEVEFLCSLLLQYELVDEGVLDAFKAQFKALDSDGSGVLDEKDIAFIESKLKGASKSNSRGGGQYRVKPKVAVRYDPTEEDLAKFGQYLIDQDDLWGHPRKYY